jgi:DNA adenine methylase
MKTEQRTVTIGTQRFTYSLGWNGQPLAGRIVALDTETELAGENGAPPPRLALATAAGEHEAVVIHPTQLAAFILAHRDRHIVTWNGGGFDFWVIERFLREAGEAEALAAWWAIADADKLHDGMLLDGVLRLADSDAYPRPRDLATAGSEYTGLEINKADPFRLRYAEIIGVDWSTVDTGFFDYAICDAIVTWHTYKAVYLYGKELCLRFDHGSDVYPDAVARFGLFTEAIQVKKAIALAAITRNGMQTDRAFIGAVVAGLEEQMAEAVNDANAALPGVYATYKKSMAKSGKPSMSTKVRDAYFEQLATGPVLRTATGKVSAAKEVWEDYAERDDFVRAWLIVEHAAKDLTFFAHFQGERVHPRYTTLVRSGRVSASNPNIMGLPRKGDVRGAFVASPGCLLLATDYSAIELRTFVAHAWHRYGWSDLRNTFFEGVDPHERTGAMMLGMDLPDFLKLKKFPKESQEYKQYKEARQAAKPINFGVPGGLGAARIAALAKKDYKVVMTETEAAARKNLLMQRVTRELQLWLEEDAAIILSRSLHNTPAEIKRIFGDMHLSSIRKTLAGNPIGTDGVPYSDKFVTRIWAALNAANKNPELAEALANHGTSEELARTVCHAGVATLTGRIRGRASYGQCRNTPFQGLAADGAGLAIYRLVREGFQVVAFLHDEVIIELPDEGGYVSLDEVRRVEHIMIDEMQKVLCGGIPVAVESGLMYRWQKGAEMRVDGNKAYPLDSPPPQSAALPPEPPQSAPTSTPPTVQCRNGTLTLGSIVMYRVTDDAGQSRNLECEVKGIDGDKLALEDEDGALYRNVVVVDMVKVRTREDGDLQPDMIIDAPSEQGSSGDARDTANDKNPSEPASEPLERDKRKGKAPRRRKKRKPAQAASEPALAIAVTAESEIAAKAVPRDGRYPQKPLVWFGGSAPYAFDVVKRLPRHLHYVEPFAGSAAVFFARDPQDEQLWFPPHKGVSEVLNDRLGNLVNFYRVLRDRELFAEFARLVELTPYGRPAFDEAVAHVFGTDPVRDAVAFFVLNRMSRAGDMKGFRPITRSRTRGGINGDANQWLGIIDGLEAFHLRLRQGVIENLDAIELIKREDAKGTFYFVDPPYPQSVVNTVNGYELMMDDAAHRELIDTLAAIKGKAMVVCYAHPTYNALHLKHGWHLDHFHLVADTAGGETKGERDLCVWTNYPPTVPSAPA